MVASDELVLVGVVLVEGGGGHERAAGFEFGFAGGANGGGSIEQGAEGGGVAAGGEQDGCSGVSVGFEDGGGAADIDGDDEGRAGSGRDVADVELLADGERSGGFGEEQGFEAEASEQAQVVVVGVGVGEAEDVAELVVEERGGFRLCVVEDDECDAGVGQVRGELDGGGVEAGADGGVACGVADGGGGVAGELAGDEQGFDAGFGGAAGAVGVLDFGDDGEVAAGVGVAGGDGAEADALSAVLERVADAVTEFAHPASMRGA